MKLVWHIMCVFLFVFIQNHKLSSATQQQSKGSKENTEPEEPDECQGEPEARKARDLGETKH